MYAVYVLQRILHQVALAHASVFVCVFVLAWHVHACALVCEPLQRSSRELAAAREREFMRRSINMAQYCFTCGFYMLLASIVY